MMGLFAVMCVCIMVEGNAVGQDRIRVATGEWPPHNSDKMEYHGVISRIITESFALEGVTVEYGFFPWKRALDYCKDGEWDALSYSVRTPEREEWFHYSQPLFEGKRVFFHLRTRRFDWATLDDVKELRVGIVAGFDYGEAFHRMEKRGEIVTESVTNIIQNLEKLNSGRIDLSLNGLDIVYHMLHTELPSDMAQAITHHPRPVHQPLFYLAFSKKNSHNIRLMELFDKGLQRLKDSGKYDRYFEESRQGKYIITND